MLIIYRKSIQYITKCEFTATGTLDAMVGKLVPHELLAPSCGDAYSQTDRIQRDLPVDQDM